MASTAARIGDAHANYGLIPGAGGSVRLARVVLGTHMAKYLAFTGSHFPASSPVLAGLVSEIVDPKSSRAGYPNSPPRWPTRARWDCVG